MEPILNLKLLPRLSIFLIACCCFHFAYSESILIKSIPIDGDFIATDHLRNCYVITTKNELIKLNENGTQLYLSSQKKYGKLAFVDANNPLNLLLFYPEFSTILSLDKTLSEIGSYDLGQLNINRISTIARSSDNKIWIYDLDNYRLKKIDETLSLIVQSDNLNVLLNHTFIPNSMLENNHYVYLNDSTQGILVFDTYGTYSKTIPIKGLTSFQIIEDQLVYFLKGELKAYNLKTFMEQTILLPNVQNILNVKIEKERLYILSKGQLDIYKMQF